MFKQSKRKTAKKNVYIFTETVMIAQLQQPACCLTRLAADSRREARLRPELLELNGRATPGKTRRRWGWSPRTMDTTPSWSCCRNILGKETGAPLWRISCSKSCAEALSTCPSAHRSSGTEASPVEKITTKAARTPIDQARVPRFSG